jgi:hypothetical protein
MTTITLEVNPEIAAAYQAVSSAEREQITKIVSLLLQNPKESDLAFLRRIMDDISDKAEASNDQPEKKSYWYELASMFDDDPYFDEFVEAMAEERRRLAIEEMANYEEEEVSAA